MRVLDLFSGIGGFSLGLERAGMETIAFCEIEDYPVSILNKHWPEIPVHRDIKELDGKQYRDSVDIVCGGFPCQPFSVAGKQRGKEDDRHLWPEMLRIIKECKPTWVIGENVAGFIRMALDDVLLDLETEGYTTQSFVVPACAVGAIHRRDRVWIIAHSERKQDRGVCEQGIQPNISAIGGFISNTEKQLSDGISTNGKFSEPQESELRDCDSKITLSNSEMCSRNNVSNEKKGEYKGWEQIRGQNSSFFRREFEPLRLPIEPPVCHRDDGVSNRVARLKALGNSVVPQIPELIGRAIMAAGNE